MEEKTFSIPSIRLCRSVSLGNKSCTWFEMDHWGETSRSLTGILNWALVENHWSDFITEGSTVIDVGAHSGDTALPQMIACEGTVLAIEPNPRIKPYLDFTCNMNGHLGNFITCNYAVTTTDVDSLEILDHSNDLCNGGMIDDKWSPELKLRMAQMSQKKVNVVGKTLENICKELLTEEQINNISFIKTDTEGHDVSILESSADFLQRLKPTIFIEWFFAFGEQENDRQFAVIEDLGYVSYDPKTLELTDRNKRTEDLLLVHKDRIKDFPILQTK